jgi:phenylalanyl-tRNA synthetase beta subunit
LPMERERVAAIFASKDSKPGAPYYAVKTLVNYLLNELSAASVAYVPIDETKTSKTANYYEPGRSATIMFGGQKIGRIGEFKHSVKQAYKLPEYCAGFALDISTLLNIANAASYQPLNRYPEIDQDICLRTAVDINYSELEEFVLAQLDKVAQEYGYNHWLKPIDIYQKDKEHKQTTWRITLSHPQRTLTTDEANKVLDIIANEAKKQLKAERV